ncbi:ran GTPase-activating protein 1-like [Eleutherodactylus coqui]|uniref:ran GTPase-activating protein 1-like n=1 Tax=Eleutherodactylus coqui TaxID=57060 RepID=UPI0034620F2F
MGGECAALFRLSETMWSTEISSLGFRSAYASVTSAEEYRLVTKCMQLLPSPLFKKERLMPTNPEAQRPYRPTIKEVIRPRPTKAELALRARAAIARMLCEGLDDEDEEEKKEENEENIEDEEVEEKKEKEGEEDDNNIQDEEVEEEEREEEDLEDEEEEDRESSSEVPSEPLRGIQDRSLRRSRIRQRSIHHGSPRMWGKKNIMWTILRRTLHL